MSADIGVQPTPRCPICQNSGPVLYDGARDLLFGTPGTWQYRRCAHCRSLWQDPMVTEGDVGRLYERYYTHARPELELAGGATRSLYRSAQRGLLANRYGYRAEHWSHRVLGFVLGLHPGRAIDAEYQAQFLPADRRGALLDVGCGHGATLADMHRLGWRVQGVDPDPAAVEAARSRGFTVTCGSLFSSELRAGSFDAITMSQVIEHVHRPVELLARCCELLVPGGVLVAMTPNADSRAHKAFGVAWRGLEPPRHLQVFSVRGLELAARQAGFSHVTVRATIRSSRGIYDASRAIRVAYNRGAAAADIPSPTLTSELWQIAEWFQTLLLKAAGTELLLIATRDAQQSSGSRSASATK